MDGKKILIVDDEEKMVEMIKLRLEANHYHVLTASDGLEGIKQAREEKPDLIILDVLMPNLDGYGFVKEMKKINEIKKTPVIIFTARPDLADVFKGEGVQYYLIKPYNADEFLKKIKEIWEK